MADRYPVVIVGGGPVGLALAIELGLRDIPCALIERKEALHRIPKGSNLNHRTMEHFHFWGIEDDLRAARVMTKGYAIGGITAYGNLMSDYWFPWSDAPAAAGSLRSFFYTANERLPQYQTEMVLRRRVAQLPSVTTYMGWAATAVAQTADGVTVSMRQEEGPGSLDIEGEYIVGCDGAHSLVREAAGIELVGENFDQRMVLIVLRSKELHEALQRFPERTTYRVLHPELKGYWRFFGRVDVGEEWFFHAPVPHDATLENFDAKALLESAAGLPFACELDYVGFWDLRIGYGETYRNGRIFIAGDAAHSHPPYGGFGVNMGFEDAVNLGWKLAAVLQGWGGPTLLDTYTAERRPVFAQTAEDVIAAGIASDRAFLDAHNPNRDLPDFEAAWRNWAEGGNSHAISYEPHYEGSPIVADSAARTSGIHGEPAVAARPGHHLAPRLLSNGRNVYEELDRSHTLIALDANESDVAAFETAAGAAHLPLNVIRDTYAEDRLEYAARLILVRPDQFVAWSGDTTPDAAAILATAIGIA